MDAQQLKLFEETPTWRAVNRGHGGRQIEMFGGAVYSVREYVRLRLHGFELRQRARDEKRRGGKRGRAAVEGMEQGSLL